MGAAGAGSSSKQESMGVVALAAAAWCAVATTALERVITRPELCEPEGAFPTASKPTRAALVLRGDSFRGLSYAFSVGRAHAKTPFYCDAVARRIQRSVVASHVAHIVEPLEAAGLRVDVYLATYGCAGNATFLDDLRTWYGRDRVVAAAHLDRAGANQATPANHAVRWLRDHWPPGGYQSVLLWRFDVPALRPMGAARARSPKVRPPPEDPRCLNKTDDPKRPQWCWCAPLAHCDTADGWDGYVTAGGDAYFRYEDDWGHSFPGWLARCAAPVFASDCLAMRTKMMSHECNFRLAKTFRVHAAHPPQRSWEVYREDYVDGRGATVCRVLAEKFDGPPCPADDRAGRRVACLRYAHAAKLTSLAAAHRDGDHQWRSPHHACDDFGFSDRDLAGLGAWHRAYEDAQVRGWDPGRAPDAAH